MYYYRARYLDPTGAMWLSVDPLFEKYAGMSPYNYCAGNPVKMVDVDGREAIKYEEDGQKFIESNVVITLQKIPQDVSERKAHNINERNESFKNSIINTLENEFNGKDGSGSLNSNGEKIKFKFNYFYVYLEGDQLDYYDNKAYSKKDYIVPGYKDVNTEGNNERMKSAVKPAIFTRWKMPPVDQSNERGKTVDGMYIYYSRECKANAHEFLHTLGVPDNGYNKGGLLNHPIQPILPSEVDAVWNNAYFKINR